MDLVEPTDFAVLAALAEGRNTPVNIAARLDLSRSYANERLSALTTYALVRHVGPAEHSGLYELTDRGRAALAVRDEHGPVSDLESRIASRLDD